MKLPGVSEREQRTLAAGFSLVVLMVGAGRGLPAWRDWRTAALASAEEAVAEMAEAEMDIRQLQPTLDTLQHRQKRFLDYAPKLVAAGSPAIASAAVGSLLTRIAEANGVQVASIKTAVDTGSAQLRRVSADMEALTDVSGLTGLLRAIEGEEPLLNVAELSIQQPEPAAPDDHPESLRVNLRVQGLFLAAKRKGSR